MSALALSVLLSFVSAVAYAGGAIVQEQVALSCPDGQYAPLRRPSWWAAVVLNGLGGLLHVVALAYGPLSLVQPLGALTIVFALPMAALFVGRKAGAAAWRGAVMATVGLAGVLSLVGTSDGQSLDTAQRVGVALVTGAAVVALMIAGRAAHRHPAVRSVLLATASGTAFGMSSVFTKTVAVDWTGGVSAADLPSLAVIGVFAVAGVLLSQAAYRGGGLAAPLATLTVVNPVLAAAVGITMFGETFRYGTTGTALALSCGVVAAGGLTLLTTERLEPAPHTGETAPQAAAEPEFPPAAELPAEPVAAAGRPFTELPRQRSASVLEDSVRADVARAGAALEDSALADAVLADVALADAAALGDVAEADAALQEAALAGTVVAGAVLADATLREAVPDDIEGLVPAPSPYTGLCVPLPVL
ncbi:DMT family transporter [Streptomyces sp. NPDC051636]|uniref:DMT family transporter n=1 Tax=Streptomyces sp. NPDC051636 TaxID=3365663 RepID=UPI00378B8E92